MGRRKRTSRNLEKVDFRLQSIKSIGANLDLGSGLTVAALETEIDTAQARLDEYNQQLASLDEKSVLLREAEKRAAAFSERMLAGIAARYGKDSAEYAQAGGIRKSDYKRTARKITTKTSPTPS